MKNILIATDLSINCDRALNRAISLAKQHKCKLHILHVMKEYFVPQNWDGDFKDNNTAVSFIKSHVDSHSDAKDQDIEITVLTGDAFSEILSFSIKINADLIIMGLHNKTSAELRDLFIGTTIERIIRKGVKPVLMVKDVPTSDYKKVLLPTDFSIASQNVFEVATQLEAKATFNVLHVYDVPFAGFIKDEHTRDEVEQEAQKQLDLFTSKALEKFKTINKSVSVQKALVQDSHYAGIMKAVQAEKPDLIAMGTNGRSGVANAILGSLAKDILATPPCDILVSGGF